MRAIAKEATNAAGPTTIHLELKGMYFLRNTTNPMKTAAVTTKKMTATAFARLSIS